MKQKYDVIVLGVGTMGAAACAYLAAAGVKVLGLDQFQMMFLHIWLYPYHS